MKNKWGFIGCGNLAQAIIEGALQKKLLKSENIFITNRTPQKIQSFSKKHKIQKLNDNKALACKVRVVVLGTKPQDIKQVLQEISPLIREDHTVISLAAGVDVQTIRKYLPKAKSIVRVMANTPVKIQEGVFGLYFSKAGFSQRKNIFRFFSALGLAVDLKQEQHVDAITAAAASGAGFVFEFMRIFENWLVKQGMSSKVSRDVSVQTFLGAALLASKNPNVGLLEFRQAVTSKKGTTLAGLRSMKKHKLEKVLSHSLGSASKRAKEISKSLRQPLK